MTATILSIFATILGIILLTLKSYNDSKAKLEADKNELNKEGKDAFKNSDRPGLLNFLRKLRASK